MSESDDYERWLQTHGVGTVAVDLSKRSHQSIRLYLDDVRPCPVGWTVARSVKEAIELCLTFRVSYASLDHDLGACTPCLQTDPNAAIGLHCRHIPDGMEFVRWLVATGCWPENKPTVHSMNAGGRQAMQEMIERHYRTP